MVKYNDISARVVIKNPQEHLQKCWVRGVFYESHSGGMLNEVYKREKKGGKYVDIGASIGNHTLFFGKVMKGEVVSFEPQPASYTHLIENAKLNGLNIKAYNVALGDQQGMIKMVCKAENNVGMYEVGEGSETPLHTLDMYADAVKGYDVMKIDVENYNRQLLTGAREVLMAGTGSVYIEADGCLNQTDEIMKEYEYVRIEGLVMNHTPTYLYIKK